MSEPSEAVSTDIMRAEAMAAYTRSLLEPLVQSNERLVERVAELERENGRQAAELDALRAQNATLVAPASPQVPEPSTQPSRLPWRSPWLYGVAAAWLIVVVGALMLMWK